ncbi:MULTISPECIES: YdhR family protein [unclassified Brenneria]|uniref:YdhR family protein n=1 Tax=unclassified Brenneria TaxID=2634434 RepID=UPI0029C2DAF7|nr:MULTISPECIES: YdhR family protein [unclassified Brenneria]MDX5628280.1 YdhR family protein [Brenneria sp. L3-3Z]MDX5695537.1 YdhR family protein [Brenneria sp. L4-2C]
MAYLLQVTYRPSARQLGSTRAETFQLAQKINKIDGLIAKIWMSDPQAGLRGGTYLFDDRAHAEAWRDEVMRARTEEGATDMQAHIFEVLDDFTALTWNTPRSWVK